MHAQRFTKREPDECGAVGDFGRTTLVLGVGEEHEPRPECRAVRLIGEADLCADSRRREHDEE
jgi:hypothetical protein